MELDELKSAWSRYGDRLERALEIDRRILEELLRKKTRRALAPYGFGLLLEVVFGAAMMYATFSTVANHGADPRYLTIGGALAFYVVAITGSSAYLFVNGQLFDDSTPVVRLRQRAERMGLVEYHAFKWALLGGIALWLPALLIAFEAITGIDALARVDAVFLVGNLIFGLVVLAIGQWLSRRYVEDPSLGESARRIVDALSGHGLARATRTLRELEEFQGET